jgi:hypothetical protein
MTRSKKPTMKTLPVYVVYDEDCRGHKRLARIKTNVETIEAAIKIKTSNEDAVDNFLDSQRFELAQVLSELIADVKLQKAWKKDHVFSGMGEEIIFAVALTKDAADAAYLKAQQFDSESNDWED